jgi:hypothetical protein
MLLYNRQKDFGYEMHFFDQDDFVRNSIGIPRRVNQQAYAQRFLHSHKKFFLVEAMRQRHLEQQQQLLKLQQEEEGVNHANSTVFNTTNRSTTSNNTVIRKKQAATILPALYAMDSSPYYLLASDRIPDAILCVAPWAKWLAVLRNPISRAESHFRHLHQVRLENHKRMVDWQMWIDDDIRLLTQAGVLLPRHVSFIQNNTTSSNSSRSSWNSTAFQAEEFDAFAGSAAEMQAWKRYNRSPSSQQIVGRGLYAIQIGHYIAALRRKQNQRSRRSTGDDNSTFHDKKEDDDDDDFQQVLQQKLLVLTSEDLAAQTQKVYNRVLNFLDLPRHVLLDTSKVHAADTQTLPDVPMPHHIRMQLQRLYEPYNQRLFQMLQWKNTTWQ